MINRLICTLLAIALMLPAPVLAEGMIEWDRASVEATAKASPEPAEAASLEGMATLPPVEALKTEGPLAPADLPEAPAEASEVSDDAQATEAPQATFAPIPEADIVMGGNRQTDVRGGKPSPAGEGGSRRLTDEVF